MSGRAGPQFSCGTEPVFFRRSGRTASGLPEFMREGRDLIMSERDDAMPGRRRLSMLLGVLGAFECLPRMLVSCQVFLFSMLLGNIVGVRRDIVQLGGSLVVFVMRSAILCRHTPWVLHDADQSGGDLAASTGALRRSAWRPPLVTYPNSG